MHARPTTRFPGLVLLLPLVAAALLAAPGRGADVVALGATRDVTLFSEADDKANGSGAYVFAGRTNGGNHRRALLHFNVGGSMPTGATINSVTLQLRMSRTQTGNQNVTVHRLLQDWGEGSSDAGGQEGDPTSAALNDATWRYRFYNPSNPGTAPQWSTLGGSFVATSSATTPVGGNGLYNWSGAGLVADVQAWLNGTQPNHGWLVKGNEGTNQTAKRFDSRQNGTANNRPLLTVNFTPPVLTGACCAADGSCAVPGGQTQCLASGGTYQGNGSTCTPNPCPPPTGACCLPVSTCQDGAGVTESFCTAQGGIFQGALSTCAATVCPVQLEPFVDALPLPAVAQPVTGMPGGAAHYQIAMREVQQQLHRDLPPTTVWGYGDGPTGASYPGPTLEARKDQLVTVDWINDLRDTSAPGSPKPLRTHHYLPVDTCPHGAHENHDARVVVHLHGGHVDAASDGYPEDTFPPGQQSATYEYPNHQIASPLWYHDHALGITRLNVYMGLAGLYLLRDDVEDALGLPSGEFEVPLVIQDRSFNADGSLAYPMMWHDHVFGDKILVNGKVWPYLNVKRGKYRFRIYGGSSSRSYTLALSNGASFVQIGAEGGLLPAPVTVSQITIGPGERADVVVDFAPYAAGTEILLVNSAPAPFPGPPGVGVIPDVMKFVVGSQTGHTAAIPGTLRPLEVLSPASAVLTRDFELDKGPDPGACSAFTWRITTKVGAQSFWRWDDVTEFPELGTTEIWRFINKSGATHPMHMHLVMFQVLDRQACEVNASDVCVPFGAPVPAPPQEAAWKDTVQVGPNEIVRVIARFEDYIGKFSYHCHILEHEDHEMMRQFQTVSDCSDGIDNDGDGAIDCAPGTGDPGCTALADLSEREPTLPCDDGQDDPADGDTRVDFDPATKADAPSYAAGTGDPGCFSPSWTTENPQCQDGVNNDLGQDPGTAPLGHIDFDGGQSIHGACSGGSCPPGVSDPDGNGVADPDPQCSTPWKNKEKTGCGLGWEIAPAVLLLLRRRRA